MCRGWTAVALLQCLWPFAVFARATARAGGGAPHPNKRGRAVDVHLSKAYQASDLTERLSGTFPLVGLITGLVTELAESGWHADPGDQCTCPGAGSVHGFSGPSTPPALIVVTKFFWPWLCSSGSCSSCTRSSPGTVTEGKGANFCSATDGANGGSLATGGFGSFNLICQGLGWFTTYFTQSSLANLRANSSSSQQSRQACDCQDPWVLNTLTSGCRKRAITLLPS